MKKVILSILIICTLLFANNVSGAKLEEFIKKTESDLLIEQTQNFYFKKDIYNENYESIDDILKIYSETLDGYENFFDILQKGTLAEKINILKNLKEKYGIEVAEEFDLKLLSLLMDLKFVPGEIIVKFIDDVDIAVSTSPKGFLSIGITSIDLLNKKYKVSTADSLFEQFSFYSKSNVYRFVFDDPGVDIYSMIKEYVKDPRVLYAEPNYILTNTFEQQNQVKDNLIMPNDPYFDQQWALHNYGQMYPWDGRFNPPPGTPDCDIDAPEAWDIEKGSSDIVIAIIDSGVDYTHPDIADNIWINEAEDLNGNGRFDNWPWYQKKNGVYGDIDYIDNDGNGFIDDVIGWDFSSSTKKKSGNNDPMDNFGHGTHCAGIAGAVTNNDIGVAGISWNSRILPLKVGEGKIMLLTNVIKAIYYAVDNGANVISMSLGGPDINFFNFSNIFRDAVDYAYAQGAVLVAAAGNNNRDSIVYPAGFEKVIAVAATDSNDDKAIFSNYGFWLDVAAPGVDILSLRANGTDMYGDGSHIVDEYYYVASGTSMACPFVAGIAALILSQNPNHSPDAVRTIISNSVDQINNYEYIGRGRINAHKAVQMSSTSVIALFDEIWNWVDIKGTVELTGKAGGEDFQYYTIEYGKGKYPKVENWIEIKNSDIAVEHGILSLLNTTLLDDGIYTLRLNVIAKDVIYSDIKLILVNNEENIFYVKHDGTADFLSIEAAVDNAGHNDTVFVFSGTYLEKRIGIITSIKLIGEDKDTTIIDGSNYNYSSIIAVSQHNTEGLINVTISNFTIINQASGGITLYSTYNSNISNNIILANNKYGIYLNNCNKTIISNNIILDNQYAGIYSYGDANYNLNISNNKIHNSDSSMFKSGAGIWLENNYDGSILSNEITGCTDCGIFLMFSVNFTISNNFISNNEYNGIMLFISFINFIKNNQIVGNKKNGIYLNLLSSGNIILNNKIINNQLSGMKISGSFANMINKNNITNNKAGIILTNTSMEDITNQKFFNLGFTVETFGLSVPGRLPSVLNCISNNCIENNNQGVYLLKSNYNLVQNNNITKNVEIGLYLNYSKGNRIKNNNFIDNNKNAYFITEFIPRKNIWKQNFWDNSLSSGLLPKIIFGKRDGLLIFSRPWFNFDWNPANKAYIISID
jgi:parallel beta-helix repeat protein